MKLEKGDYLEFHNIDFIRQNLSWYEPIWGAYIGHDGKGSMIQVKGLSSADSSKRVNFSEYLYTCLESIICMNFISSKPLEVDLGKPEEYLEMLNQFMAFKAHAGRLHDNAEKLLYLFLPLGRTEALMTRLNDIYQTRNTILHGKKMPYRIEESLVLIPEIQGEQESNSSWNSKMTWSEIKSEDLVFLTDYVSKTLLEICKTFNDILGNLREPVEDEIRKYSISIPDEVAASVSIPNAESRIPTGISGFSGSTADHKVAKSGSLDN